MLAAPASARGVKIGILNDRSGAYADHGGKYSVDAARMAIEDNRMPISFPNTPQAAFRASSIE